MPRLYKIEIKNYRAFYEAQPIPVAIPAQERPGSGLTIVVGANNSGKSTVLDALLLLQVGKKIPKEERHGAEPVVITLTDDVGSTKTISNQGPGGSQIAITGDSALADNSFEFVPSRRHWNSRFGSEQTFEQFRQATYNSGRPDAIDSNLGTHLASINRNTEKKERFNGLMRRMLPTFNTWVVESDSQGDYIEYSTRGGATHQTNRFGDGLISLFRLIAHLTEASQQQVLVIDEPELSLHPQAQMALAALLSEQAAFRQILIASHSPHFVRWSDLEAGAQIVRVRKKGDIKSHAFSIPGTAAYKAKLLALDEDWQKPQLLDTVAKELFFADNVVFVEGQEDVSLLRRFIESEGLACNFEFFGYGCGGAGNIPVLLQMAKDLGLESAALFDGDKAADAATTKATFSDAAIEVLPTDDIRDKHRQEAVDGRCRDTDEVWKSGVFDRHGQVKPEHKVALRTIVEKFVAHFDRPVA